MCLRFRCSFKRVLNLFANDVDNMILYDAEIVGKQHQIILFVSSFWDYKNPCKYLQKQHRIASGHKIGVFIKLINVSQ